MLFVKLACLMVRIDNLPVLSGLIVVAVLLLSKRRSPRIPAGWVVTAVVLGVLALPLPYICMQFSAAQYNLAEMFRQDKLFPAARLALLSLWVPLTARWAANMWRENARARAIAWGGSSCLVGWGFLRRSVTVESINDVLGSPVLGLPMDAEYILRFGCLYFALFWLPIFFAVLAMSCKRGLITWAIFAVSLTFTMPAIIQNYSPSDNVRELFLTGGGHWFAILCLYWTWVAALCSRVGLLRAIGVAGLAVVPAWMLLSQSINISAIHGLRVNLFWFGLVFAFLLACVAPAMSVQQPSNQLAMPRRNKIVQTAMSRGRDRLPSRSRC